MQILLIDNYDSFTFNVYQYLGELGHNVSVVRNNKISLEEIRSMNPDAIFISPGPGYPIDAGISVPLIKEFAGQIAIFGICLGHQAIGEAFGGRIDHAKNLFHGKTSRIFSCNKGVMKEVGDIVATRYHSLVVSKQNLPNCLEITCETEDGEIMGLKHKEYNIEGVQFHPESIMTKDGKKLLKAFLDRTQLSIKKTSHGQPTHHTFKVLNRKEKQFVVTRTLAIHQYAKEIQFSEDCFAIFRKLQNRWGREKVFLLESVEGPTIDCQRTLIGVFPRFELIMDNELLEIKSSEKKIKEALSDSFKDNYALKDNGFSVKGAKFSEIYNLLSKIIKIDKKHSMELNINNGLAGYFSYEYLHCLENIPKKPTKTLNIPEVHLKYFSILLQVEQGSNKLILTENRIENEKNMMDDVCRTIDLAGNKLLDIDIRPEEPIRKERKGIDKTKYTSNVEKEAYVLGAKKVKEYIRNGDIFQVQLAKRICVSQKIDPMKLYEKLRKINPSPYMFYWDNGDYQLIGDSPELQLRIDNGEIVIRPIAGTSKGKGKNEKERQTIIEKFKNDPKELAEHVMLVDLARNDIGIVATIGSVHVSRLINVEEFSHVFHLVSTVEGELKAGSSSMEVFEATFPAGTLTGAPKVRAMEIISEIEPETRGAYGGAFGFFDFNGNLVSSIIIRTAVKIGDNIFLQAAAGIVADSVPEQEWDEIGYKMQALKQAISESLE